MSPGKVSTAVVPDQLRYDEKGLIPVVVQDAVGGAVLMLAYADRRAVELTLETGEAHFWSRSRQRLWKKGETSGHVLEVVEVLADCDSDALLVRAHPAGPTCHRDTRTCFEPNPAALELGWLWQVLRRRSTALPEESYTARLRQQGLPRIAQKVGEEATEVVVAALAGDEAELVGEASDLLYHLSLLLETRGVSPEAVAEELRRRHRSVTPKSRERARKQP